ncbi:MAG: ribosome recycling factor [Rhodothermales bacterium]
MVDQHIKELLEEAEQHMEKSMDWLRQELNSIRAGRATPSMIENVRVEYYGSQTPLNQIASISAPQPDLLIVQPWDRSALEAVEKGIMAANMGLNPSNDGAFIRIPVPPLSEERRRELVKTAKGRGEEAKIGIRNIRRDVKDTMKKVAEEKHISEDMEYEGEERLQEITDKYTDAVDRFINRKEEEIMEV